MIKGSQGRGGPMIKGREVSYLTDLAIVGEDGGVSFSRRG